ncbi:MAG: lipopolysaccharide biosynthesis protein [Pirellulales bacterium]
MVFARLCDRGLGMVSTVILARLLLPGDFGIVAMAMSVVVLLELWRAFGLDIVLIQHPAPQRIHYDTAFTINFIFSLGVSVVLTALSVPTANFFSEPKLIPVLLVLAIGPVIDGLRNIGILEFRKNLQFKREFTYLTLARLIRFVPTIFLAFTLRTHWALVIGILIGKCTNVIVSYLMHSFRPRLSLVAWRELYDFSKWIFVKNIIQLLRLKSADFVIGRVAGLDALGIFNLSGEIANLPSSEIAAPLNSVIFPGYAKHASDQDVLRRGLLEVFAMIVLVVLPLGVGLMATAEYVVLAMLGNRWMAAVPVVVVLTIRGITNAIGSNTGSMFLAMGRPKTVSMIASLELGVLLPTLLIGVYLSGPVGAAWAYVASSSVVVPLSYFLLMRELNVGIKEIVSRVWRPVVAVTLMVLAVSLVAQTLPISDQSIRALMQLIVLSSIGATIYVSVVLLLWFVCRKPDGAERRLLDLIFGWVRRATS